MTIHYNEEIKAKFLEELSSSDSQKTFLHLFKRAGTFEGLIGKDIFDFNSTECINLVVTLEPKSVNHVGVLKSQFNKYTEWAMSKGFTSTNFWGNVPINDDFAKLSFASRYVKNLEELTSMVESGLNALYDKYVPYLLFMGVMGESFEEICSIKRDDTNSLLGIITTSRRQYTKIIPPLLELMQNDEYFQEHKPRDEDSIYFIKPFKNKSLAGKPIGYQYISRVFSRLNDAHNNLNPDNQKNLTPMTCWRSGLFYALYQTERSKGELINDDYLAVSEVYGNTLSYGHFSREYELYKDVFWDN